MQCFDLVRSLFRIILLFTLALCSQTLWPKDRSWHLCGCMPVHQAARVTALCCFDGGGGAGARGRRLAAAASSAGVLLFDLSRPPPSEGSAGCAGEVLVGRLPAEV